MVTGVAYAMLAARRNRLCWIAGAVSSALRRHLSRAASELPMQSALQVFYVGMSVYGWLELDAQRSEGELPVGLLAAALAPGRRAGAHCARRWSARGCSPPKPRPRGRCSIR